MLNALVQGLSEGLVERTHTLKLTLLAALAGEHTLLLGPPGTAKSELARRLTSAFEDGRSFERLLTRFTVPEELFGPYALSALERDEYSRQIEGYLPTAHVGFLDEIFKSGSAVLNSLLSLLNERIFHNGTSVVQCPLIALVGASNERPEGEALQALADRFLMRLCLEPISAEGFATLIDAHGAPRNPLTVAPLPLDAPALIQSEANQLSLSPALMDLLIALRQHLHSEGIYVSDRRWHRIVGLLKVAAFTEGQREVTVWEGVLLPYCIGDTEQTQRLIADWYAHRLGARGATTLTGAALEAWAERLTQARSRTTQAVSPEGEPLYVDLHGRPALEARGPRQRTTAQGDALFLPPDVERDDPRLQQRVLTEEGLHRMAMKVGQHAFVYQEGMRIPLQVYLADPENMALETGDHDPLVAPGGFTGREQQEALRQLDALRSTLKSTMGEVHTLMAEANAHHDHLWLGADRISELTRQLHTRQGHLEQSLKRLAEIRSGFIDMPLGPAVIDPADDVGG
ncbi:MAG: AAA family ATPase [Bradymonadia bacterium]